MCLECADWGGGGHRRGRRPAAALSPVPQHWGDISKPSNVSSHSLTMPCSSSVRQRVYTNCTMQLYRAVRSFVHGCGMAGHCRSGDSLWNHCGAQGTRSCGTTCCSWCRRCAMRRRMTAAWLPLLSAGPAGTLPWGSCCTGEPICTPSFPPNRFECRQACLSL